MLNFHLDSCGLPQGGAGRGNCTFLWPGKILGSRTLTMGKSQRPACRDLQGSREAGKETTWEHRSYEVRLMSHNVCACPLYEVGTIVPISQLRKLRLSHGRSCLPTATRLVTGPQSSSIHSFACTALHGPPAWDSPGHRTETSLTLGDWIGSSTRLCCTQNLTAQEQGLGPFIPTPMGSANTSTLPGRKLLRLPALWETASESRS